MSDEDLRWLDYAAMRRRIPIRHVLQLIEYRPTTRRGKKWRGPCPLDCSPATPLPRHFSVHLGRDIFFCFGCGRSGNQLDLWAAITRLDLRQATLDLCRRLGMPAVEVKNTQPEYPPS